jgi:hypothetical protein
MFITLHSLSLYYARTSKYIRQVHISGSGSVHVIGLHSRRRGRERRCWCERQVEKQDGEEADERGVRYDGAVHEEHCGEEDQGQSQDAGEEAAALDVSQGDDERRGWERTWREGCR